MKPETIVREIHWRKSPLQICPVAKVVLAKRLPTARPTTVLVEQQQRAPGNQQNGTRFRYVRSRRRVNPEIGRASTEGAVRGVERQ